MGGHPLLGGEKPWERGCAEMTSSKYLFQNKGCIGDEAKALCSTSSVTKLAITADNGRFAGFAIVPYIRSVTNP